MLILIFLLHTFSYPGKIKAKKWGSALRIPKFLCSQPENHGTAVSTPVDRKVGLHSASHLSTSPLSLAHVGKAMSKEIRCDIES